MEYIYYLFKNRVARLKKEDSSLKEKEFFLNGSWKANKVLTLYLNDAMMDYGDYNWNDYEEISEEKANSIIASQKDSYLKLEDTVYEIISENEFEQIPRLLEDKGLKKSKAVKIEELNEFHRILSIEYESKGFLFEFTICESLSNKEFVIVLSKGKKTSTVIRDIDFIETFIGPKFQSNNIYKNYEVLINFIS